MQRSAAGEMAVGTGRTNPLFLLEAPGVDRGACTRQHVDGQEHCIEWGVLNFPVAALAGKSNTSNALPALRKPRALQPSLRTANVFGHGAAMKPSMTFFTLVLVLLVGGCADPGETAPSGSADGGAAENVDGSAAQNADGESDATAPDSSTPDTLVACDATPSQCALAAEQRASERLNAILGDPAALDAFLAAVPKGGDLHMHLSGAVYAETYLQWAREDFGCLRRCSRLHIATNCSNMLQGGARCQRRSEFPMSWPRPRGPNPGFGLVR